MNFGFLPSVGLWLKLSSVSVTGPASRLGLTSRHLDKATRFFLILLNEYYISCTACCMGQIISLKCKPDGPTGASALAYHFLVTLFFFSTLKRQNKPQTKVKVTVSYKGLIFHCNYHFTVVRTLERNEF